MGCKLSRRTGLTGPRVDEMANAALQHIRLNHPDLAKLAPARTPHHITLLSKEELRNLPPDSDAASLKADTTQLFDLGVGANLKTSVLFVVVIWVHGQQIRKRLGLPPKQFHITLSGTDVHNIDKGIDSLLPEEEVKITDMTVLDHLVLTLQLDGRYDVAERFAIQLCQVDPDLEKGYLRLADCAVKLGKRKLAMLAYASAFARDERHRIREYCLKKIAACAQHTEWGTVFTENELQELPDELLQILVAPWSLDLRTELSDQEFTPSLCIDSRERLSIPLSLRSPPSSSRWYKLPRFFRWVVPFHLALMSTPRNAEDIAMLASPVIGIKHILTLTEEEPLDASWFRGTRIKHTFLPIPNYHPPTTEQMDLIMRMLVEGDELPMLVHCGGGKGRAGTVAACYLAAYGFQKPDLHRTFPALSSAETISALRAIRPGSIETEQQENFVSRYQSTIWKRQSILPDIAPEPAPSSLEVLEGIFDTSCDLVMLIGLPGSGKSWICDALLARNPKHWIRISQDESRSRAACERQIGHDPPKGVRALLDRCNTSPEDRKNWLALAHWAQRPIAVWLDYAPELCTSRAQNRAGHPTLPPGGRVRAAIEQARRVFVSPTCAEGFSAVLRVCSFAAAAELVQRLSPTITLLKFPRTAHLLNLGAVSVDDIVGNNLPTTLRSRQRVVITEKVDGANMGFSLDASGTHVLVQNRSHYVQPDTHLQFRRLGAWVDRHRPALFSLLGRDKRFPERFILYGEWLAATHSIPYEKLPDLLLAFDLYDRATNTFVDRRTLEVLLDGSGILLVPVIDVRNSMPAPDELREMVQQESKFYMGRIEGIYLKVEEGIYVVQRGKVVRGDFTAGNEHWTKGELRENGIDNVMVL